MIDAVETVMMEQGYAALSARSIAEAAGLKHQLVFYYFPNMDDLLLAAYRKRIDQVSGRIDEALQSDRPLQALWEVHSEPSQAALTVEYMALANHNAAIRAETVAFGERIRREGLARVGAALRTDDEAAGVLNPFALTMVISCVGAILGMETSLGITGGHSETRALVQWCLDQLQARD
ncbi:AcrR family transcriptional regulator [Novosphingobium chloroacetimidivorans]|uniref:AcrR family transcriptional regulator n=1 Tax=Novosphingobium chloroacetimidivorans TaxID=1428314 RepID=A0A7W7K9U7_9SPHN|nr:TetR/AcrR family transcriptional regulator [Novosphingobium chloroacetimidivorans]MBB4858884.1 AcrR family transcriptional regulator [Novosphingobium chloroacetimidivorans]